MKLKRNRSIFSIILSLLLALEVLLPTAPVAASAETSGVNLSAEETIDIFKDPDIEEFSGNSSETFPPSDLETNDAPDEFSKEQAQPEDIFSDNDSSTDEDTELFADTAVLNEELFTEDDPKTMVFSDGNPIYRDTVVVLDQSSSMSGMPLRVMKESAVKFCRQLTNSSGRIAIIAFSSSVNMIVDFTSDIKILENSISGLLPNGGTNTTAAMEKGYSMLQESPAQIKNLVLMTDGCTENGKSSNDGPYSSGYNYRYANALYQAVVPYAPKL